MKYAALLKTIIHAHDMARSGAVQAVNRSLLLRNWIIGAWLVEFEQHGADRAAYGAKLLTNLARDLKAKSVSGCSAEMLGRMRIFYNSFPQIQSQIPSSLMTEFGRLKNAPPTAPISSSAMTKSGHSQPSPLPLDKLFRISWTHWIELLHINDPWKRAFYENECFRGNWSVRQLQRQIGSLLYERTGLSQDKNSVIARARKQARETPGGVEALIRDPFVLEFTGLSEQSRFYESDLESSLLDHLQLFLLELGTGFCFESRQKRITVGNEHDYVDLVFYHRRLRCHLLIDLKVRAFRHGDAGQMNFYLNYWKNHEMAQGDQPPVGLILCSDREKTKVEFATTGISQKLFVSRYLVALPKPEELEALIDRDRVTWEQRTLKSNGKRKHSQ
jgi:predicted nuclease of restriction endonuclease-like (RecB) superfamily